MRMFVERGLQCMVSVGGCVREVRLPQAKGSMWDPQGEVGRAGGCAACRPAAEQDRAAALPGQQACTPAPSTPPLLLPWC